MGGLFLLWFSSSKSSVTGLDFLVYGDWLAILSYGLAWIVFFTYCFKPNYVGLLAIAFSIVFPLFYFKWLLIAGGRRNPYNIFEPGSTVDLRFFTVEPGFVVSIVGMGLVAIGVFIGMNNRNRKRYLIAMTAVIAIVGSFIVFLILLTKVGVLISFSLVLLLCFIGLAFLANRWTV
ncbi:MAG: hypothetical protein WA919_02465 [Coleofasciculaceae cyanobacterium]